MSEPTTEANETASAEQAVAQKQGEPAAAETPEETISALREALRKANEDAKRHRLRNGEIEGRLTEIERANETEAQRLQREAQEAREALPKGITEAFREAAVTFGGISTEDAELFLTGSDKETLQKQAARLVERTPTSPQPDLTQGGKGEPHALNSDGLEQALKSKLGIA